MSGMATFTSDKDPLKKLLEQVGDGRIQLPEFQRGWVWDDEHIRSLLASLSVSYPIGAVMLLETGNEQIRFKARPVEGVQLTDSRQPERFILDGQQRLTSLYQALCMDKPVETCDSRGKRINRWYYIRMKDAINPEVDREDAIIGLPEDKMVRGLRNVVLENYSSPEAEFENHLFPLFKVFTSADWRKKYNAYWKYDSEKTELFDSFEEEVIKRFEQYLVPSILLLKESPKEAVCQVFEKVNTGGVPLSVFELITASFAADDFDLRADWEGEKDARGKHINYGRLGRLWQQPVLQSVQSTDFLQAVTLLTTFERRKTNPNSAVSCKRSDVLKLQLSDYQRWAEPLTEGFLKAGKFLFQQKVFTSRDLPYGTQVTALAAILTVLGNKAHNDSVRQKLARWYWCGVFGESYGSAIETRLGLDLVEFLQWIDGGPEPNTVSQCNFSVYRLYTLRTRGSAAYKGVHALLMRDGGLDFMSGESIENQTYFDDRIDIHHIFPKKYCKEQKIEAKLYDCIINKTPLSARTNRIISGQAPSIYTGRLEAQIPATTERLNEILKSHLIDVGRLRADDFDGFFEARKEALLARIEAATGRPIAREVADDEDDLDVDLALDDDEAQEEIA